MTALSPFTKEQKMGAALKFPDGVRRCGWVNTDPAYLAYHDLEWGVLVTEDDKLFEFLLLESMQAGLSWYTILKRRGAYRKAFANFNVEKVARFGAKELAQQMGNVELIRNRAKLQAAVKNAQAILRVVEEKGSFLHYSLEFTNGELLVHRARKLTEIPAQIPEAQIWAKDLKARGFHFLGPTTLYAHMQACGLAQDHLLGCFCQSQRVSESTKALKLFKSRQ